MNVSFDTFNKFYLLFPALAFSSNKTIYDNFCSMLQFLKQKCLLWLTFRSTECGHKVLNTAPKSNDNEKDIGNYNYTHGIMARAII